MLLHNLVKSYHPVLLTLIPAHWRPQLMLARNFHVLSCVHTDYTGNTNRILISGTKSCASSRETLCFHRLYASARCPLPLLCNVRHQSSTGTSGPGIIHPRQVRSETFKQFYVMRYIKQVRFLNRLKLYQTGFTVILAPVAIYLYAVNQIPLMLLQAGLSISLFACGMCFVVAGLTQRVVGVLSFNENQDIVQISHLNFFGSRSETYVDVKSVTPLSELPDDPSDLYVRLIVNGAKEPFYVSIRYARDIQKEPFKTLLGSTSLK